MAEHDWYGPLAGITRRAMPLALLTGGAFCVAAGFMDYQTGRHDVLMTDWSESVVWTKC
jgi:hypothetical protein